MEAVYHNNVILQDVTPITLTTTFLSKRVHHINSIKNFWNQAKRHLRRFNGISESSFYWFLKECEWRFNVGGHAPYHLSSNPGITLKPIEYCFIIP